MLRIALMLAACLIVGQAPAQESWPSRPLRIIVNFPPGAPNDLMVRMIAADLQRSLGQPVVVENKPGASGNIGAAEVARATDEHTLLASVDTLVTVNPHVFGHLAFKPAEDLQPVTQMASFSQMLVCHPKAGLRTLDDLLKQARSGPFNYASGGAGVPGHLAMEMLLEATQTKMTHVPYRGPTPALQDILAQAVPCGFLASPVVGPYVKDGGLVALAVSGSRRLDNHPGVPTVAEGGIAGYDATFTEMVLAPRSWPAARVARVRDAFAAALQQSEVRARLRPLDLEMLANTPEQARQRLAGESARWKTVVERIHLRLD